MVTIKLIVNKWISEPDHDGDGFLEAEMPEMMMAPIPVETHHVELNEVKLGQEQEFEMICEAADSVAVYENEKEYYIKSGSSWAAESFIPSGLFSLNREQDFTQTPMVILSGTVYKTYDNAEQFGFAATDTLCSITCQGEKFDLVISAEVAEIGKLEIGNIVNGVFYVQGWPKVTC